MRFVVAIVSLATMACAHGAAVETEPAAPHVVLIVQSDSNFMTSRTHAAPPVDEISPDAPPSEPAPDLYPELGAVLDKLGHASPGDATVTVVFHDHRGASVVFDGPARALSRAALPGRASFRSQSGQSLGRALALAEQKAAARGERSSIVLFGGSLGSDLNVRYQTALQRKTIALCERGLPVFTVYYRGDNSPRRYGLAGRHLEARGRAALLAGLEQVFFAAVRGTADRTCPARAIGRL